MECLCCGEKEELKVCTSCTRTTVKQMQNTLSRRQNENDLLAQRVLRRMQEVPHLKGSDGKEEDCKKKKDISILANAALSKLEVLRTAVHAKKKENDLRRRLLTDNITRLAVAKRDALRPEHLSESRATLQHMLSRVRRAQKSLVVELFRCLRFRAVRKPVKPVTSQPVSSTFSFSSISVAVNEQQGDDASKEVEQKHGSVEGGDEGLWELEYCIGDESLVVPVSVASFMHAAESRVNDLGGICNDTQGVELLRKLQDFTAAMGLVARMVAWMGVYLCVRLPYVMPFDPQTQPLHWECVSSAQLYTPKSSSSSSSSSSSLFPPSASVHPPSASDTATDTESNQDHTKHISIGLDGREVTAQEGAQDEEEVLVENEEDDAVTVLVGADAFQECHARFAKTLEALDTNIRALSVAPCNAFHFAETLWLVHQKLASELR